MGMVSCGRPDCFYGARGVGQATLSRHSGAMRELEPGSNPGLAHGSHARGLTAAIPLPTLRLICCRWGPHGHRRTHDPPHRRRADRPAAADPQRQCRTPHLSLPDPVISAARAPRCSGCPTWRGAAAPTVRDGSAARRMRAPNSRPAERSASACWRRTKPAIRRGWPPSTTRRLCSACAARRKR